jgi:quinohemoprotein ethanol dehydrogenase
MSTSNWWMFHGDPAHTGLVTGSGITSKNVARLKLLHDVRIPGPVLSVPAIVDGYVYVGLANSKEVAGATGGTFLKIKAKTGRIERKFEWAIAPQEGDSHGFMGMGCTPAVTGGKVYFSAFNGKLYCLDQETLKPVWITDLRHTDLAHNQPVSNTLVWNAGDPPAAGWSSPVVVNGNVYVGIGEGENPALFGFVYCLDAQTGNVKWIYCTCQFNQGVPNVPNMLPPAVLPLGTPPPFSAGPVNPAVRGCSVWSSIAYDASLNRLYCATGNPNPDGVLPTNGFSNGILSLDAATGAFRAFFQAPPESSYRATDSDVDFGGSPTLITLKGRRVVAAGCKNGGFFLLDADSLKLLLPPRQLLPHYNNGKQIPTVDPHVNEGTETQLDPNVPNTQSDKVDWENFYGTYSTPAVHPRLGRFFIGVGGNNYHTVAPGIDFTTTPFLRALDCSTLKDAWPMDNHDPRRYKNARPPMYTTPAESGLSSPAVVNDVVFCSTSLVAVYAFDARTGKMLWQDRLGEQTGGFNGGYGYCLGPAVSGNFVVAGALVFGKKGGGVLRIYTLRP